MQQLSPQKMVSGLQVPEGLANATKLKVVTPAIARLNLLSNFLFINSDFIDKLYSKHKQKTISMANLL
ncbi:MAG: hypothetical protein JST86_11940 [Bacteroidetes bacterium]|nr:hypothetical protein [Bacteroidota bacterium]